MLDRHPKLRVTLPHGGGVLLMLIGRIDHGAKVRPEIEKLRLPRPPSEYLQRFTYDTVVHSQSIMEFVISEVGADRIMIGSDYPLLPNAMYSQYMALARLWSQPLSGSSVAVRGPELELFSK